jgi:hypothetical protein
MDMHTKQLIKLKMQINRRHFVMNVKTQHCYKKINFDMLPLGVGGTCLKLPMKEYLWSLPIG